MSSNQEIFLAANSIDFLNSYKLPLSSLFVKKGFNITWLFPKDEEKKLALISNKKVNLRILSTNRKGAFSFIEMYFNILKILLFKKKVSIISHTVYVNIALILARFSLPWLKSKQIITVTGFGAARIRNSLRIRLLGRLYLSLLRWASKDSILKIVTLNFNDLTLIQDFTPSRQVSLLYEAAVTPKEINEGSLSAQKRWPLLDKKVLNIGFFGRFLIEKGFTDFLNVYQKTKILGLNFNYLIAGSLDSKNSSSITNYDLKNYPDIELLIEPNYSEYFRKLDIILFPSYREGHPLYLLKAMTYGVVPIVYPVAGVVHDVINNYNGIVVESITPTSLLSGLIKLQENRLMISELSKNCISYASNFSEEKVVNDFYKGIIKLLN